LQRIVAHTSDHFLRETLEPLLMDLPNTDLEIAARPMRAPWSTPPSGRPRDPLGDARDTRTGHADLPPDDGRFAGDLPSLTRDLSATDMAELLVVLAQQATALRLVWEAHACGAITLPESLEQRIAHARNRVPRFLAPGLP
jgi:hypothetical protein